MKVTVFTLHMLCVYEHSFLLTVAGSSEGTSMVNWGYYLSVK